MVIYILLGCFASTCLIKTGIFINCGIHSFELISKVRYQFFSKKKKEGDSPFWTSLAIASSIMCF